MIVVNDSVKNEDFTHGDDWAFSHVSTIFYSEEDFTIPCELST